MLDEMIPSNIGDIMYIYLPVKSTLVGVSNHTVNGLVASNNIPSGNNLAKKFSAKAINSSPESISINMRTDVIKVSNIKLRFN
jgi:hypothetical protein